jgi:hypothetical protein
MFRKKNTSIVFFRFADPEGASQKIPRQLQTDRRGAPGAGMDFTYLYFGLKKIRTKF